MDIITLLNLFLFINGTVGCSFSVFCHLKKNKYYVSVVEYISFQTVVIKTATSNWLIEKSM